MAKIGMMENSSESSDTELSLVTSCHILVMRSLLFQVEMIGHMTRFTYQVRHLIIFHHCWNYQIVNTGAATTSVEGITIANSAHHSLMLVHGYNPETPTGYSLMNL